MNNNFDYYNTNNINYCYDDYNNHCKYYFNYSYYN